MRTRSILLVVSVVLMALTGCASSTLFVEDIRSTESTDGPVLVVLPVTGTDDDTGRRLGENMAWGLREAGYPAIYADRPDERQPVLRGAIDETDFGEEVVWLSLRWTVHAPAAGTGDGALGEIVGTHRHQVATTIEQWAVLSRQAVNMIVAEAVPAVHELSSSLVFPDGLPVRTAGDLMPDRQLASLAEVNEGDTIVVSGDGMIVMPAEGDASETGGQDVQVAQFEPVFAPAAVDPLPPAATMPETVASPESVATPAIPGRTVPEVPPPKPVVAKPAANEAIPKPAGRVLKTDEDTDVVMPAVPSAPVASAAVAESVGTSPESGSPFSTIADDLPAFAEVDVLIPESAALVTTDPWLTINEPVALSRQDGTDEAAADTDLEPAATEAVNETQTIPSEAETPSPPPEAPEAEAQPEETQAFAQPVSETVVAERPAEEVPDPATGQDAESTAAAAPPTEVAAGEVSAGALDARAAPNAGRPIFIVRPVLGAPGDGNAALTSAMREALRQISAAVTDDPTQATHILQGNVRVDSPFAGRQKVRIVWQVTGIDGTETGKATQENQVPQGSLDGAWGGTAKKVAEAAVVGVAGLFQESISSSTSRGLA